MLLAESLLGSSSSVAANYIEDVFSTYLYTGNGAAQVISNGISLGNGATTSGWMNTLAGSNDQGNSITYDSSGNVYICGTSNVGGSNDFVLAKYNSSGVIQWQRRLGFGTTSSEVGTSIALDSSSNVYVGGLNSSSGLALIAKYDSSGVIQWQRSLNNMGNIIKIAVDGSANVYFTGLGSGGVNNVLLVAKYNTSGTIQWQRQLSRAGSVYGQAIAVNSSGDVHVCGVTDQGGTNGIQIVKLDTSGTTVWQRYLDDASGGDLGYSISLDSSDNVYVGASKSASPAGTVIAKYNSSGTIQWQRLIQDGSDGIITSDSSGNVYALTVSGGTLITKYNTSGTLQWQRLLTNVFNAASAGEIKADSTNIYICSATASFGAGDIFIAKLPTDGSGTGAYTIGSLSINYVTSFATTSTPTLTDASTSLTNAASSRTSATVTMTDAATTLTSTTTALSEGTGKGGLVWMKGRSGATDHALYDTARGATFDIASNLTTAQTTQATGLTEFTSTGFSIGALAKINTSAATYASWTFREQPKFFDVVTYTGTGANRTIAHNLGSVPGCIMIKRTDTTAAWAVYHRSLANTQYMVLNTTAAAATGATYWNSTTPTSSVFSLGTSTDVNASGGTYVAYLFAHDAGGFGATGADNVISCGSFTTNGSGNATVNLGYEPQWILTKNPNAASPWLMRDNMRGWSAPSGSAQNLRANVADAENTNNPSGLYPNATGFSVDSAWSGATATSFVYIAIRRGPMRTPTTGTSVFGLSARTGTGANATVTGGQTDDAILVKNRGSAVGDLLSARLVGTGYMETSSTAAEVAAGTTILQANPWDVMDGVKLGTTSTITNASANTFINYLFRRAPGFFDVVCYTGTGATGTQSHNLGVAPELMIVKQRAGTAFGDWFTYFSALGATKYLSLQSTAAAATSSGAWNNTAPTSSVFTTGTFISISASTFVAYLFATVAGVSKVGSYTGSGTTKQIDCGFTGGARFVLIKRTDSTGDWYVWDSARGIVAGNDPYILLNSTAAEVTTTDYVDTYSAGFEISSTAPAAINANGGSFIFWAVA